MEDLKSVFNQKFINKLERFTIYYSSRSSSGFQGIRKSKDQGRGMEFSDYRDYTKGDDIRKIDWNSYGRLNKLLVKLFEEEKQISINIFLDVSKSMDYGKVNKLIHGKVIALSLLYMAVSKSDKVNLFVFSNNLQPVNINLSDKTMIHHAIDILENVYAENDSDFINVSAMVNKTKLASGKAFLISDFLNEDAESLIESLCLKRQETVLIQILSEEEMNPSFTGEIRLVDKENGYTTDIEAEEQIISEYQKFVLEYISEIERFCMKQGCSYILQTSGSNIFDILKRIDSGTC